MLTALAIAGVLVVLFLAAALATRESEGLAPAPRDAADVVLPEGRVRADDVRGVRFGLALRGYRMSEVDAVLARLAAELEDRDGRVQEPEGVDDGAAPLVPLAVPQPAAAPAAGDADDATRALATDLPADQGHATSAGGVAEQGEVLDVVAPVTAPDTHPVVVAAGAAVGDEASGEPPSGSGGAGTSPSSVTGTHPVVTSSAQPPVVSQVVLGPTPTAERSDPAS